MFYVKGDDMEDMFKKAAENYELNEGLASDWNSIQKALQDGVDSVIATPAHEKKKRRYLFFWWLLLIPGVLLIAYTSGLFRSSSVETTKTKADKIVTASQQDNSKVINKENNASNQNTNIATDQPSLIQIKKPLKQETINKLNDQSAVINYQQKPSASSGDTRNNLNENLKQNYPANNNNVVMTESNDQNKIQTSQTNLQAGKQNENDANLTDKINFSANSSSENNRSQISSDTTKNLSAATKNETSKTNSSKQKASKDSKTNQAYFYTGLIGNIDLSFIKYQKLSAPGFGGGLTAGYHFKKRFSIEAGILYDRKNYYTSGKYFDTKNFNYFTGSNSKVLTADGNCDMWELPIALNYDFAEHKRYTWFVSAGLSSYFMHKEYYDFTYVKNGYVNQGGYSYFHTKPDWFSVMNIGAGVNMQLSNKFSLQAQPYYKIPLSKVGMANLSLTSGGINISIKRTFK